MRLRSSTSLVLPLSLAPAPVIRAKFWASPPSDLGSSGPTFRPPLLRVPSRSSFPQTCAVFDLLAFRARQGQRAPCVRGHVSVTRLRSPPPPRELQQAWLPRRARILFVMRVYQNKHAQERDAVDEVQGVCGCLVKVAELHAGVCSRGWPIDRADTFCRGALGIASVSQAAAEVNESSMASAGSLPELVPTVITKGAGSLSRAMHQSHSSRVTPFPSRHGARALPGTSFICVGRRRLRVSNRKPASAALGCAHRQEFFVASQSRRVECGASAPGSLYVGVRRGWSGKDPEVRGGGSPEHLAEIGLAEVGVVR